MTSRAEKAVRFLVSGNGKLESSGQTMEHIRKLRALAKEAGLSADHMLQLSTVITAPDTRSPLAKPLLQCLVPAENVTKQLILAFSGALCSDSLSPAVKRDIMQWMVAVHHLFDSSCNLVLLCRSLLRLLDTSLSGDAVTLLLLLASESTATSFTRSAVSKAMQRKPSDELLYLTYVLERCRFPGSRKAIKDEKMEAVGSLWEVHVHQLQQELFGKVKHRYNSKDLGLQCGSINTGSSQLLEALERHPLDLMKVLLNPEILKAMVSEGKHRQLAYFQGQLRITLNDVFMSPENVEGNKFLTSLATMVSILQENPPAVDKWLMNCVATWNGDHYWEQILALVSNFSLTSPDHFFSCIWEPLMQLFFFQSLEKQVSIFRCLTELCRFWCLVEVPRSQGCRGFVFDRTYGEGTVKALTHLVSELNRIGMALVEFHPDRLVEIMVPIFELYHMRLNMFRKSRVALMGLPEWQFIMLPVLSRNSLLIDGLSRTCLSLLEFMEDARECFEQPWLKAMTNEFHDQVSWLGLALAGEWKRACAVGPKLSPKVLEALGVSLSDTYCPVALWWQPTVKDAVAKLCQTHNIEPHEIAQSADTWSAFLDILAASQPHTTELMRQTAVLTEPSRFSMVSRTFTA
ncbi:uncharacterized protein LOC119169378 isoform X1 [Rhipicephalus microplus]|uniref:uncharacterized protein LOC119169378 isoform X1 n=1 Tax=Rhipicephalus microplus TaxID=6941 RepID=UPI003F6C2F09